MENAINRYAVIHTATNETVADDFETRDRAIARMHRLGINEHHVAAASWNVYHDDCEH